jgi:S1-C subfamily serine protease
MLAVSIGSLGVPFLTPAIASSVVLRTIDRLTPNPAKAALAQLRSLVTTQGIPTIVDALGLPTGPHTPPSFATDTAALNRAAKSVVKITGNAYACGQSQSGSGWIVAHDRILTNAHVVAGVSQPVVEVAGLGAVNGRVVYFDPVGDLAIIAAPGIDSPALTLSTTLPAGSLAVAEGFPFGGPYTALPAKVLSIDTVKVADIYGHNGADREIYALDANVQQGDSGGPLLTRAGQVVGVVFAKSATAHNIGYALTMASVAPLASKASTLTNRVSSGTCTKG